MSTTLRGSTLPRRLAAVLITALFGLTLALNPMSTEKANAVVYPAVAVRALNVAKVQISIPYKYGGTTPRTGFDCSGLTKYSYARAGKWLPRTAQQQYAYTIRINKRYPKLGDLIYFYSGNTVYHVGIYAGSGYMIDAPHTGARVRKERIWTSVFFVGRIP